MSPMNEIFFHLLFHDTSPHKSRTVSSHPPPEIRFRHMTPKPLSRNFIMSTIMKTSAIILKKISNHDINQIVHFDKI